MLKWLMHNDSFKSYEKSLSLMAKNPLVILPFFISWALPLVLLWAGISLFAGKEGINFYYGNSVIITYAAEIRLFVAFIFSALVSALINGIFNAWGYELGAKNTNLKEGWVKSKKHWLGMAITNLSLLFIAIILTYPALLIISVGGKGYWIYTSCALFFYYSISFYSRAITISSRSYGFSAIKKGMKFFYKKLSYNLGNTLIVGIVFLAFSLLMLFPLIYSIFYGIALYPWVNLFFIKAYLAKK